KSNRELATRGTDPGHRKGRPSRGKRRPEERGGSAPVDGDGRGLPGLPMLRVVRVTERLQGAQLQPVVTVAHLGDPSVRVQDGAVPRVAEERGAGLAPV